MNKTPTPPSLEVITVTDIHSAKLPSDVSQPSTGNGWGPWSRRSGGGSRSGYGGFLGVPLPLPDELLNIVQILGDDLSIGIKRRCGKDPVPVGIFQQCLFE